MMELRPGEIAPAALRAGGQVGALIESMDWSDSPIGPPALWPLSFKTAVGLMLPSKAQIVLFWGAELTALYNDAYAPTFGSKHPWALGRPARECLAEVWEDTLRALFEGVLRSGESFNADEYPFFLERHGYLEETYYDVSYDPVRAENGGVGGIFCIVSDATGRVPHAYFGWTEGNPVAYLLKYMALGEGDTAPVTREVLRQVETDPHWRPRIHLG